MAAFSAAIFRERLTEIFLMVQRNRCDGNRLRVRHRSRVEPSAKSGFEDCEIDVRLFESKKS